MIKYCRADVELLSKAVLRFRHMFKERLDIDPFRYVTLASLCMAIFRGCFLPDKSIVANEQNKPISKVCNEWLIYLNDDKLIPEVPIFLDKSYFKYDEDDLHKGKLDGDTTIYYQQDKHTFTPDALCRKRKLIKEFNGCKWHGCPKCNPECKAKYNRTMEQNWLVTKLKSYGSVIGITKKKPCQTNLRLKTKLRSKTFKPVMPYVVVELKHSNHM